MTAISPASLQKKLNSRNHDGDGQNVLFNDGHVDWVGSTFYGANRDCIYSLAKILVTTGQPPQQENPPTSVAWPKFSDFQPKLDNDSVLLPAKGAGF